MTTELLTEAVTLMRRRAKAHIASWHPAVALAVADWLEETQGHYVNEWGDGCVLCSPGESGWPCTTRENAENVARAYLGRDA